MVVPMRDDRLMNTVHEIEMDSALGRDTNQRHPKCNQQDQRIFCVIVRIIKVPATGRSSLGLVVATWKHDMRQMRHKTT